MNHLVGPKFASSSPHTRTAGKPTAAQIDQAYAAPMEVQPAGQALFAAFSPPTHMIVYRDARGNTRSNKARMETTPPRFDPRMRRTIPGTVTYAVPGNGSLYGVVPVPATSVVSARALRVDERYWSNADPRAGGEVSPAAQAFFPRSTVGVVIPWPNSPR